LIHLLGRPLTDKEKIDSKNNEKENRGNEKQGFNLHQFGRKKFVIPIPTQPPLTLRGGVEGLMEKHNSL